MDLLKADVEKTSDTAAWVTEQLERLALPGFVDQNEYINAMATAGDLSDPTVRKLLERMIRGYLNIESIPTSWKLASDIYREIHQGDIRGPIGSPLCPNCGGVGFRPAGGGVTPCECRKHKR